VAAAAYALFFAYVRHDFRAAVRSEVLTRATLRWPWTTLLDAWRGGLEWQGYERATLDWLIALLAIALIPLTLVAFDVASALYGVLMVLFPLLSGLYSYSRLLLPAFPVFAVIARLPPRVLIPLLVVSMVLQAWLFAQFVRWEWIA
jgi:hypothetical protein